MQQRSIRFAEPKTQTPPLRLGGSRSIQLSYRGLPTHCLADRAEDEEVAFGPGNGHDQVGRSDIMPIPNLRQARAAGDDLTVANGDPFAPVRLQIVRRNGAGLP